MPGITLELAQTQLELYLAAEAAVLTGQSYEINGRKLTRADLGDIQKGLSHWNGRITTLTLVSTRRNRVIVPAG